MKHFDDLVVGAGLFGCVFAHEMRRQGRNVLVIDKRDHVAGTFLRGKSEEFRCMNTVRISSTLPTGKFGNMRTVFV